MSKELAKNQPGQITLTKRKQKRTIKSLLPKVDPPAIASQQVSANSRIFKPVVATRGWLEHQRDALSFAYIFPGILEVVIAPFGVVGALGSPQPLSAIITTGLVAMQAMWIPAATYTLRVRRAKQINFSAFLKWLHDRYGVTLDSKQQLYSLISNKYAGLESAQGFVDDQGRSLSIEWAYIHDGFVVKSPEANGEPSPLVDERSCEQRVQPRAELSYPLRQLYSAIQERFTTLAERNLSPESDHVVARAKRDVAKVVNLYADLARLRAIDAEQEAAVQATFTSLVNELTEVVKKETAFALRELTVETTYVAARQPRRGIDLKK